MAEPETAGTATVTPGTPPQDPPAEKDWQAEAEKWKRMSRENEGRAKDNADAAKRLTQLEESQKTESQKLADAKASAEERATGAELRALRLEVAFEKGLTSAQAKRLVGRSKTDLEADADEIKRDFPIAPGTPPKADPSQGNHSTAKGGSADGLAEARRRFPEIAPK
jgi:hypothetical protein